MAGNWYDDTWNNVNDFFDEVAPEPTLEGVLFGVDDVMDEHAQDLMWEAMVDGNESAYMELVEYMWEQYGIDFEAEWDWEDFREWYESQ